MKTKKLLFISMSLLVAGTGCKKPVEIPAAEMKKEWVVSTLSGGTDASRTGPSYYDGPGAMAGFSKPMSIAVDVSGNVYVADYNNHRIRKITPNGTTTTLAGSGVSGYLDGNGTEAQFNNPSGVAVDKNGNVFVADMFNNRIRKITPAGTVTTFAGSNRGFNDAIGINAKFANPIDIAIDANDNLYVADLYNHDIRKITPDAVVTTYAGLGYGAYLDGPVATALMYRPTGVAVDKVGNVYVSHFGSSASFPAMYIRKITPDGMMSTFTGGFTASAMYYTDGRGKGARFNVPRGMATDATGNLYVADSYNNCIRKIAPDGIVSTFAGDPKNPILVAQPPISGNGYNADNDPVFFAPQYANGPIGSAKFWEPYDIAIDASGSIYVCEGYGSAVRKISFKETEQPAGTAPEKFKIWNKPNN